LVDFTCIKEVTTQVTDFVDTIGNVGGIRVAAIDCGIHGQGIKKRNVGDLLVSIDRQFVGNGTGDNVTAPVQFGSDIDAPTREHKGKRCDYQADGCTSHGPKTSMSR